MVPIIFLGKWGHFQKSVQKIWDIWGGKKRAYFKSQIFHRQAATYT